MASASSDWRKSIFKAVKKDVRFQGCVIGFDDSTSIHGFCRLDPDIIANNPRISLSLARGAPTIVIGLQDCTFDIKLESKETRGAEKIRRLRDKYPDWFQTFQGLEETTVCITITITNCVTINAGHLGTLDETKRGEWQLLSTALRSGSATIIMPWKSKWKRPTMLYHWMSTIHQNVHENLGQRESLAIEPAPIPEDPPRPAKRERFLDASNTEMLNEEAGHATKRHRLGNDSSLGSDESNAWEQSVVSFSN